MKTFVVTVQGKSHIRSGIGCEDAAGIRRLSSCSGAVLAVADGLGSTTMGGEVGKVAVDAALDFLVGSVEAGRVPDKSLFSDCMSTVLECVGTLVLDDGTPVVPDHGNCTLQCAVLIGSKVWFLRCGDGCAIFKDSDGQFRGWAGDEMAKDGYCNETSVISQAADAENWVVHEADGVVAVLLSSDGLSSLMVKGVSDVHAPAVQPFIGWVEGIPVDDAGDEQVAPIVSYLKSDAVKSDDDLSLAIVVV